MTPSKVCFTPECAESKSDRPRKGWRLRSGEFSELCDRCGSAYEEGRYCDIFHVTGTGWRCCESCGKRVHCGCVVSIHAFAMLDTGGIECITCARKNVLISSHAWPPSLFCQKPMPERVNAVSVKNWNNLAGSGPVPWRQAPYFFHSPIPQPEFSTRMSYEADKMNAEERFSGFTLEKRKVEDVSETFKNGSPKFGGQDIPENMKAGINCEEKLGSSVTIPPHHSSSFGRNLSAAQCGMHISCSSPKESNSQQPGSLITVSHQLSSLRKNLSTAQFGMHMPCLSPKETNSHIVSSGIHLPTVPSPPLANQFQDNLHNGITSTVENRNGSARGDAHGNHILSRYWPRFSSDQEIQQISGNTSSLITPLFEKMLSASDAGRIGRLVIPKKCAEAYFPPICQPDGLPLKVQDSKGKEWIFQFRFWPNNSSRMYVLEGVTPCMQNMQLQAGDIVTFSRLDPEGKLIMGCRKTSMAVPADEVEYKNPSLWTEVEKECLSGESFKAKSPFPRKRRRRTLVSKTKRLRIENENPLELKLTWEEGQRLLRAPLKLAPSVVVIEGFEFEEYEDAPIIGRPIISATTDTGNFQWVQCEDCFKWRKLPAEALLPTKWTCSDNALDLERSSCSASQELTNDWLEELLSPLRAGTSKRLNEQELDILEPLETLDTIPKPNGQPLQSSPSPVTTKHPRHRVGCSCIVCIQSPSGKGSKHKQTCICTLCQTVKRRFCTLMSRHEKKEAEIAQKKNIPFSEGKKPDADNLPYDNNNNNTTGSTSSNNSSEEKKAAVVDDEDYDDGLNEIVSSSSPFKGQIDLNIQPEREEELLQASDTYSMMKLLQDCTDRYLKQRLLLKNSAANNPSSSGGGTEKKVSNEIVVGSEHREVDKDKLEPVSMAASGSNPVIAVNPMTLCCLPAK